MTKRTVLAILSGILLVLSFPPFGMAFLAWGALVPFLFAVDGLGWRGALIAGFVFGFAFYLGGVYWVVHSMYVYGGVPFAMSVLAMLILVFYLSVYAAAFGFLARSALGYGRTVQIIAIPALWVALEYARGHLFTGFPWVVLGYTQAPYLPLIQIADNTGVWGVSFVVVAVNVALFLNAKHLAGKGGDASPVKESAIAIAMLLSVASYGFMAMKAADNAVGGWRGIEAGVAQGSIDQGIKWDATYREKTLEIYNELSIEAGKKGARLIVWPETAIPFYFEPDKVKRGLIGETLRKTGSYILTGSPAYTYNPESRKVDYFNSAFLLAPDGEAVGRYDKIHLVPFGEYVPLKSILPIHKLTVGIEDFKEGPGPYPLRFEGGGLGMLICYESIFPEIARLSVRNGATLLVNLTNDGWFGTTSAPYQHFQMAVLRAVENKSYLIRSANTGISAVIDPVGRVRKKTALFEKSLIVDRVKLRQGSETFYTRHGDVFAYGCLVIAGAFMIFTYIRRNRDV